MLKLKLKRGNQFYGSEPFIRKHEDSIVIEISPSEYLELVSSGHGYASIAEMVQGMDERKIEEFFTAFKMGAKVPALLFEYKWTGNKILFSHDGRHRARAAQLAKLEEVTVEVLLPENEEELQSAYDLMPEWFLEKVIKTKQMEVY